MRKEEQSRSEKTRGGPWLIANNNVISVQCEEVISSCPICFFELSQKASR